jgi:calcineurin-like phosphoesterase family protein
MTRYLISDHHFTHDNIIAYCDRPFTSVGEMHDVMLSRFHEVVAPDDTLYHLGDVAMAMRDPEKTGEWLDRLSDSAVLVRGNHDAALDPDAVDYPVVSACVLEAGDYRFYCTHRPEDAPEWWDGWVLHGHHHDNHPEEYPLVRADEKRVNVSAELLDYRPVSLSAVAGLLDCCAERGRRLVRDRSAAAEVFGNATR